VSPSEIGAWSALIDKGGTITLLVAGLLALAALCFWLLQRLLAAQERQIERLHGQLDREQDLLDQALDLARERSRRRGGLRESV